MHAHVRMVLNPRRDRFRSERGLLLEHIVSGAVNADDRYLSAKRDDAIVRLGAGENSALRKMRP